MEIIAHRGASHDAPENTLAAARLAWTEGADALELDIRLTADDRLAVVHDEDTRRVAGVPLVVKTTTMTNLTPLDVGLWKNERYAGEKIPVLDEMLATVPDGKRVFIEIKGGSEIVPFLARCLAHVRLESRQIVVISFDLAAATAAKKTLPHVSTAWILDCGEVARHRRFDQIIGQCRAEGLDGLDLEATCPIDAAVVRQIHRAGLKLFVWTVDDPALARRLAKAGVDGVATNRPGWLRHQLAR